MTGRIPRVMVIDDEPDAVMMLLQLLRIEGYSAHGYASGRAALSALREVDPDVVICDVAMPAHSGWDVAREIRSIMGERRPMLIAISGQYRKPTDKIIGQVAGFNHYLTKPYDPQALLGLIANNKRHRQSVPELGPKTSFRILSDDEFQALSTEQRIEYLKEAMLARNSINRQIEAEINDLLPRSDEQKR